MALLNQLIDFDPIVDALWKKAEPKIDELSARLMALLPVIGAAAAKAIADKFPELLKAILDRDPDAPFGLSNIFDLSEFIRNAINDDPRIPVQLPGVDMLSDLFKGFGGQ